VEVSATPDKAEDHVIPVDIYLEPRKRLKFTVGAGFGTDTGLRGKIGFEQRRANRLGHRYRLEALASQIKLGLNGEYIIPGSRPSTDRFVVRSSYIEEDSESIDSKTALIGVSRQRQDGLWLKNLSLDFQRETFSFDSDERTSILLMPSLVWTRVDVENRLDVTRGSRISLELRGAYEDLLSDVSFIQAAVRGKWIRPLGENGRLLLRGSVGTSLVSEFDDLPATVRFFAGGDRSVRGFELDEIGPRNEEGDVIGGRHLIVGSVEYEYRIRENWSIAAFVDSGTAFDDTPDFKTGVGAGVRWHSPVGPVRVDLASGLEEPGEIIRLHVTIGPDL
jgi:translocation and assembly module TamA